TGQHQKCRGHGHQRPPAPRHHREPVLAATVGRTVGCRRPIEDRGHARSPRATERDPGSPKTPEGPVFTLSTCTTRTGVTRDVVRAGSVPWPTVPTALHDTFQVIV